MQLKVLLLRTHAGRFLWRFPWTQTEKRGHVAAAADWNPPALFMEGRAPFRAQRRLPPKGTYCWLRGKLSVLRSCRRCFSLRMEWMVFRKSFLLSGELGEKTKRKNKRGIFLGGHSAADVRQRRIHPSSRGNSMRLTCSTAGRSSPAAPPTPTWCGRSRTRRSPRLLRWGRGRNSKLFKMSTQATSFSPLHTQNTGITYLHWPKI